MQPEKITVMPVVSRVMLSQNATVCVPPFVTALRCIEAGVEQDENDLGLRIADEGVRPYAKLDVVSVEPVRGVDNIAVALKNERGLIRQRQPRIDVSSVHAGVSTPRKLTGKAKPRP